MERIVFVVPHTHWDREWYFTLEDSELLLTEHMRYTLDMLERFEDFPCFCLDGQSSLLESFVRVCPQDENRLKRLISQGRIHVGPWYTQSDTLLVHTESLIRNLSYGTHCAQSFGRSMKIGYLPDVFGQNAYLPSVFQGFGIDCVVFQRGLRVEASQGQSHFWWCAPDGVTIQTCWLPLGYGVGKFLSTDADYVQQTLVPNLEHLVSFSPQVPYVLLPAGGDQALLRIELLDIVRELLVPGYRFELASYESFAQRLWQDYPTDVVVAGEMRDPEKARIHRTIGSTRMDIKQDISHLETDLLHGWEPLQVLSRVLGEEPLPEWTTDLWKTLFESQSHDSIGGCNSDATNLRIRHRIGVAQNTVDNLMYLYLQRLSLRVSGGVRDGTWLFGLHTGERTCTRVEPVVLFAKTAAIKVCDDNGTVLPLQILSVHPIDGGKIVRLTPAGTVEEKLPPYYRIDAAVEWLAPSMGYQAFRVFEVDRGISETRSQTLTWIENEALRVECVDGTLALWDKQSQTRIADFLYLEDAGDEGDSYDFSPFGESLELHEAQLESVQPGPLVQRMQVRHHGAVPKDLESRRQGIQDGWIQVQTLLELRKGEPFLRVSHVVDNQAQDHRLRVLIRSGDSVWTESYSDTGFALQKHPAVDPYWEGWEERGDYEAPAPVYNMRHIVALGQPDGWRFAIFVDGLKEYELVESSAVALTLLRGVGLLGRDNLAWRPGRASGINNTVVTTPDAQLTGRQVIHPYAIWVSGNSIETATLYQFCARFQRRVWWHHLQTLNSFEHRLARFAIPPQGQGACPTCFSLLSIPDTSLQVSACYESPFEAESVVVRVFNPTDQAVSWQAELGKGVSAEMRLVDLRYHPVSETQVVPYGYASLQLTGLRWHLPS